MKRTTLILFFLAGLGEILAGIIHHEILHFICKPLIMILLAVYIFVRREGLRFRDRDGGNFIFSRRRCAPHV